MPLKIAVSGKGGVGKTTVAALLASQYAREGMDVIAVDADPASSLPAALGVPYEVRKNIVPLSEMLDVIEERTGVRPGESYGRMFSLNPKVDDLVDKYAVSGVENVQVMVLGTIKAPGSGCFCPESALLKNLMSYLVLDDQHVVILDMEAGLEHLGRSTVRSVDVLLVVVEPGLRSVETAMRIADMACSLGIGKVLAVLNKVSDNAQENEIRSLLDGSNVEVAAAIYYDQEFVSADLAGRPTSSPSAEKAIALLRGMIDRPQ
ncbi:MAG: dehydrogenase maturation factor [Candidatus Methanomethylophilaceae archaeon]|nr:dehydrogenase maturation factor [Candidatus Methanomethylophilaceae archaeon]